MSEPTMNSAPELTVLSEENGRSTRVDLKLDGRSVSRLWLSHFTIHIGKALVRMDGVGGVGTDEAFRSKGYCRRVLQSAVETMKQGDGALSMLYGIRDFYPKFGYATAGPDYLISIGDLDGGSALPPGWKVRAIVSDDLAVVKELYSKNTRSAVGAALRDAQCGVWKRLEKAVAGTKDDECRVVVGPDGEVHGYLWRARWCWYVRNALEPDNKRALVLGEVVADCAAAADAVLAVARIWAKSEPASRRVKEVLLACTPGDPVSGAATHQDAVLSARYSACGASMVRVVNVVRLLEALLPELVSRLNAADVDFEGSLVLHSDEGDATLNIGDGQISVTSGSSTDSSSLVVSLPQYELGRLCLGAFPPEDILARLPEQPSIEAANLVAVLFPARHPQMYLPDRY